MNILYIASDGLKEINSSLYRVCYIGDALRRKGHKVNVINVRQWLNNTKECVVYCSQADIIHLQRVLVTDTHERIKYWRSQGKAVVADWDDSYENILDSNAAAPFWKKGEVTIKAAEGIEFNKKLDEHPVDQFRKGLTICTAGITPSEVLSKDWQKYAPTYVVKNYFDVSRYVGAQKERPDKKYIYLGWGGSLSHTQSWEWSGIQHALQAILSEREDVRLFLVGDQRVLEQLPIRRDRIIFHPYVPWWDWARMLSYYDIGLAPLSGIYDDRRSSLKVAEYIACGLPFVATRSPVYEEFFNVNSGKFILPGDDRNSYIMRAEQWYKNTIDVIDNLSNYRQKAEKNMHIGAQFNADDNVDKVIETYEKIIKLEKEER